MINKLCILSVGLYSFFISSLTFAQNIKEDFINIFNTKDIIKIKKHTYKRLPALIYENDTIDGYWSLRNDTIFFINIKAVKEKCFYVHPIFLLSQKEATLYDNEKCKYLHNRKFDAIGAGTHYVGSTLVQKEIINDGKDIVYTFEQISYSELDDGDLNMYILPKRRFKFSIQKGFIGFESKNIKNDKYLSSCFTY